MKLRLFILIIILAFAAVGTSFAASGSYKFENPDPNANCGITGHIISYDLRATNFSGTVEASFFVNGELVFSDSQNTGNTPFSLFVPDFTVSASITGGPHPEGSVYGLLIIVNGETELSISWICSTGESAIHVFSDGRINRYDAAAPIAVYANGEGIQIWEIDANSEGHLVLSISIAEIDAVAIPAENTLLGATADGRISVWRLSNGEFQIVAPTPSGKTYHLFFSALGADAGYTSYES